MGEINNGLKERRIRRLRHEHCRKVKIILKEKKEEKLQKQKLKSTNHIAKVNRTDIKAQEEPAPLPLQKILKNLDHLTSLERAIRTKSETSLPHIFPNNKAIKTINSRKRSRHSIHKKEQGSNKSLTGGTRAFNSRTSSLQNFSKLKSMKGQHGSYMKPTLPNINPSNKKRSHSFVTQQCAIQANRSARPSGGRRRASYLSSTKGGISRKDNGTEVPSL